MDKNLPRWIKMSVIDYFVNLIQVQNQLHVFIETTEHVDENGNYVTQLPAWTEARVNGPITTPITISSFKHEVTINFIISTKLDKTNVYDHDKNVGIVYSGFATTIAIFKLGDGAGDDGSAIGCLQLEADRKQAVMVSHFGQLDTDVKLTQSTVEGHYFMHQDL